MVIISTSAVATIIQAVSAELISDDAAKAGVASPAIAAMIGAAKVAARRERAPMMCPGGYRCFERLLGLVLRFRSSHHIAATSFANFGIKEHDKSMIRVRL
jgi:hypothetical protein